MSGLTINIERNRWLEYQKERFPLVKYSILTAAFSASGLYFSSLLTGIAVSAPMFATAFTVTLFTFAKLRVADEHKDFEHDSIYHPDRPVQRGLISLAELRNLAAVLSMLEIALVMSLSPALVVTLFLLWSYMFLMSREFFAARWLRERPVAYIATHMSVLFFTDLFITSCHFLTAGLTAPRGLIAFLALSFSLGLAIEIGRKIKPVGTAPDAYSEIWGVDRALSIWITTLTVSFLIAAVTIAQVSPGLSFIPLAMLSPVYVLAARAALRFKQRPSAGTSESIDTISGIWVVASYLSVGAIAFIVNSIL